MMELTRRAFLGSVLVGVTLLEGRILRLSGWIDRYDEPLAMWQNYLAVFDSHYWRAA